MSETRMCVTCGKTVPAELGRAYEDPACTGPDGQSPCLFDLTEREAADYWRAKAHEYRIQVEDAMRALASAGDLNALARDVHAGNARWWQDPATGAPVQRNVGELLMLCVSELAEAMEGHRKGLPDDHLPHRSMFEVEIADCVIRILDLCGGLKLDLAGAVAEKRAYNRTRADHSHEARLAPGGKRY
jgi:NTP pyrophosphatase (non-canonical NTP hydrolase)